RGVYLEPFEMDVGRLALAVHHIPSLAARLDAAVEKISRPPIWDPDPVKGWMWERIRQAADVILSAKSDHARMDDDVLQFKLNRPVVEHYLAGYGNSRRPRPVAPPTPAPAPGRMPVIVSTDLFYPAPETVLDDYFDVMTLLSMPDVDVQAVILDNALA